MGMVSFDRARRRRASFFAAVTAIGACLHLRTLEPPNRTAASPGDILYSRPFALPHALPALVPSPVGRILVCLAAERGFLPPGALIL